jgi:hypothetical protein
METKSPSFILRRISLILVLSLAFAGCTFLGDGMMHGLVYKHYRRPLTVDLDATPSGCAVGKEACGKLVKVSEPFTKVSLSAEWNSTAIGDLGRRYGLKKVYFADLEVKSILSIYTTTAIYLYGE